MNQSTRIMFLIGMIFNVLEITALLVGFIGLCMAVGVSDELYVNLTVDWFKTPEEFTKFLTDGAVSCAFGVVISAAVLVCAILAQRSQEKNRKSKVWPIVMIVLGALNNVIYLVAGILCLIENQEQCVQKQTACENTLAPAKAEATQTVVAAPVIATEPAKEEVPAKAEPKKAPAKTATKKPAAKTETKVEKKTVAKTPAKKETAKTTKTVVKETPAKKPASKPASKTAAKAPAKKPAAKTAAKTETKKAPAKTVVKKAPAKASAAKTPAKKPAAKTSTKATAKKPAAKKIVKR